MRLCAYDESTYRHLSGRALVKGASWAAGLHLVAWRDEALATWAAELERGGFHPCPTHRQCSVRCWRIWMGYFAIQAEEDAPEVAWTRERRVA